VMRTCCWLHMLAIKTLKIGININKTGEPLMNRLNVWDGWLSYLACIDRTFLKHSLDLGRTPRC
jgi:hypothetical protein